MDRDEQARLREILVQTLDDMRLSRSEAHAMMDVVDDLAAAPESLAYFRNEAFRLAKEQVEEHPTAVLAWIERVDKICDRAGRSEAPAELFEHVAFSPGDECLSLIRTSLGAARATIDACVFTITDDRITKSLLDAHRRGVKLRVITDDEKASDTGSDIDRLRDARVSVKTDHEPDHMHHKFAVIDGRLLLTGSYNWTRGATGNNENLYATSSPRAVEAYAGHFEKLWRTFGR